MTPRLLGGFPGFKWRFPENAFGDTSEMLRSAMAQNPYMSVLVLNGYYDMATPYFATEWTFANLELEPMLRPNVSMAYYQGGHMMYADIGCLKQMTGDVGAWYDGLAGTANTKPRALVNVPGRSAGL